MAYSKQRTDELKSRCDDYYNQWTIVESENAKQTQADQALQAANTELAAAAQKYSPSSPEYQAAAKKQADAQAARDAQYQATVAARTSLDNIQVDIINRAKGLQS